MSTPNNTSGLAYFVEVTSGTPPANAAAWVTNGVRVRHIMESLDVSSFKQSIIEDQRSQENVQDEEVPILGIKGGVDFPFDCYAHGLGATAAAGDAVVQNTFSDILEHCMGGVHLSRSTTATGGTTTTAILTVDTDMEVGAHLVVVLPDMPQVNYPRRVVAFNGGTNTVTFDEVLPRAVAAADVIHGCATHYFDEDALNDSAVGPTTLSWLLSLGRGNDREHWEARGCKTFIESIALPRNGAPKFSFKTLVASFATPNDLLDPAFVATPGGNAGTAVGPRTSLFLGDYGSTVAGSRHAVDFNVKPGGAPMPCETGTEVQSGMPGISHYGLTKDKTTATLKTLFSQDEFDDFDAQTLKQLRWVRHGGPGVGFALGMPRCSVTQTPSNSNAGPSLGMDLEITALRDVAAIADTDLARSRLVIVTW